MSRGFREEAKREERLGSAANKKKSVSAELPIKMKLNGAFFVIPALRLVANLLTGAIHT